MESSRTSPWYQMTFSSYLTIHSRRHWQPVALRLSGPYLSAELKRTMLPSDRMPVRARLHNRCRAFIAAAWMLELGPTGRLSPRLRSISLPNGGQRPRQTIVESRWSNGLCQFPNVQNEAGHTCKNSIAPAALPSEC